MIWNITGRLLKRLPPRERSERNIVRNNIQDMNIVRIPIAFAKGISDLP